jgi:hypothetical protein
LKGKNMSLKFAKLVRVGSALLVTSMVATACNHMSKDMPNDNGRATRAVEADYYTTVTFQKGQTGLTDSSRKSLDAFISDARTKGEISEVKVAAWPDVPFDNHKKAPKVSSKQKDIASDRADKVKSYLKDNLNVGDVDTYTMTSPNGKISEFFGTDEAKLKTQLASEEGDTSKALVMVKLK